MDVLVSLSINKNKYYISGKLLYDEKSYTKKEVYFSELHKIVNSDLAYSACFFKGGHRRGKNYLGGNSIIILDFDEGLTLEEAKEIFKDYICLITTTRNHQKIKDEKPAYDRFRVIFPLLYAIDLDAKDFKNLMQNIVQTFKSDKVAVDAARFYYGNPDGEYFYNLDGDFFDWTKFNYKTTQSVERQFKNISKNKNADHIKIIERCKAMQLFAKFPTRISYQLWLIGLNTLCFCTNGEELCHEYSVLDSKRYKPKETDRIIASAQKLSGATLCNSFIFETKDACQNCEYRHLINSPISLGREKPCFKTDIEITKEEFEKRLENNELLHGFYKNKKIIFAKDFFKSNSKPAKAKYRTREEASKARLNYFIKELGIYEY